MFLKVAKWCTLETFSFKKPKNVSKGSQIMHTLKKPEMFKNNSLPCNGGGGPAIPALLKSALQLVQLQHLP
jgi:hypothetical protein